MVFVSFVENGLSGFVLALGVVAAVGLVAAGLDRAGSLGVADPPRETRRPAAVRDALLAGFCFWMGVLHFLRLPHWATSFGWVALSFYFAFYLPVFVGLSRVAVHRLRVPVILAAPIVWTGLELARGHLLTGMSMACLGHTQYRWIELIQLSDLAGAYGVSFVVMFVAASLARMLPMLSSANAPHCNAGGRFGECSQSLWPLLPAAAMLAAAMLYGHVRIGANSRRPGRGSH